MLAVSREQEECVYASPSEAMIADPARLSSGTALVFFEGIQGVGCRVLSRGVRYSPYVPTYIDTFMFATFARLFDIQGGSL
jgi:hypothetical protein